MADSLVATVTAAVTAPLGFLRALADLPRTLELQARRTEELLRAAQEQLALMREQTDRALAQMREVDELAAALRAALAELERVNDQLAQIVAAESERAQSRGERFSLFRRGQRQAGETA